MKKKSLMYGLMLVLAMCFLMVGCSKESGTSKWNDGTYSAKSEGMHGDITVSVEISKGKIAKVEIVSHQETIGVSDLAIEQIPEEIVKKQSTEVDAVAGATISSDAIKAAVEDALNQAKK